MPENQALSEDEIAEYQEAFMIYDTKGDGMIPANLVGEVIRALGHNPTEAEVKRLVHTQDASERVSFETFLPILQAVSSKKVTETPSEFVDFLKLFDNDEKGVISSAELRYLLTAKGERVSEEDVEALIHGQENSSGNINYEEFVKMVLSN